MVGRVAFAVPGDLATPTGGYAYDRRMIAELRRLGWDVDVLDLGAGFPRPSPPVRARAMERLSSVPHGGAIVIDGLALGETTPGPLIIVVSFVGFVGGWSRAIFGPDALVLGGAAAATVVTFFTFLPSFVFILLGGPFIESTHGNLTFTAPLTAITAAVVGVIANLAVFFAYHVLWPAGFAGAFEWRAALIGVAAAIALMRFRAGVIPVVLGSGVAGLIATSL